jgi:ABC transporter
MTQQPLPTSGARTAHRRPGSSELCARPTTARHQTHPRLKLANDVNPDLRRSPCIPSQGPHKLPFGAPSSGGERLTEPVNEGEGLVKRFGKVQALAGFDLVARSDQVTAVLGPNGAGKTTYVRSVATLVRPDAGTLRVAGIRADRHPEQVRGIIGLAWLALTAYARCCHRRGRAADAHLLALRHRGACARRQHRCGYGREHQRAPHDATSFSARPPSVVCRSEWWLSGPFSGWGEVWHITGPF